MNGKRLIAILVVSIAAAAFGGGCTSVEVSLSPLASTYADKRIAVVDITDPSKSRLRWTIGLAGEVNYQKDPEITQRLEQALIDLNEYDVIDMGQVRGLAENKDALSGGELICDSATAVRVAKVAGLDGIVIVQSSGEFNWAVIFAQENYRASARLVDVETGKVVWSANGSYNIGTIIPFPMARTYTKNAYGKIAEQIGAKLKTKLAALPGRN